MWDRDWIRSKDDVRDLFQRGSYRAPNGKDAFAGRTPLYGYFAARMPEPHPEKVGGIHWRPRGFPLPSTRGAFEGDGGRPCTAPSFGTSVGELAVA